MNNNKKINKICPDGKILNIKTNRCVNINGKIGKQIINELKNKIDKKDKCNDDLDLSLNLNLISLLINKLQTCNIKSSIILKLINIIEKKYKKILKYSLNIDNYYFIINESILYNYDKNDVIVDPAGLPFMQTSFQNAGFGSGAIYKQLSTTKPNPEVINHFLQFKNQEYLYEKNKNNLSIAIYSPYKEMNIIHAVGPDFTASSFLTKIIDSNDITNLYKLLYKVYNDIYKSFINEYKKNNNLILRLLPLSSGAFIGFNKNYKIKIFKCFFKIYQKLNKKYKIYPIIFLYSMEDYNLFLKINIQ